MENNLWGFMKYRWVLGAVALVIFGWGFSAWFTAHSYQPEVPEVLPAERYQGAKPERAFPLERYRALLSGDLFFPMEVSPPVTVTAPSPVITPAPTMKFHSKLVLWGLIKDARGDWAVVGNDPQSTQDTRVVTVGDTVDGEQIIGFSPRSILVRNSTGEGRVELTE